MGRLLLGWSKVERREKCEVGGILVQRGAVVFQKELASPREKGKFPVLTSIRQTSRFI